MTTAVSTVLNETDLATVIRTYNEVTERLKVSHERLRREVCRLRDELHEKNRELQRRERLAALGEMAAGVAHEIRNPLGGIGLYASLLQRDLTDQPEQLDIAGRIGVGVRNIESIVGDILAFAGDAEPNRSQAKLAEIMKGALTQATLRASELRAHVAMDVPGNNVDVFCDSGQIERALLNLLLNALDAAGEGGHVWVWAAQDADEPGLIGITVEDDGPGIAPDLLQRVFNPFFTTKDTGTGLGLAIVHRIAESHGGRVTVCNRGEGGAVFTLRIPAALREPSFEKVGGDK